MAGTGIAIYSISITIIAILSISLTIRNRKQRDGWRTAYSGLLEIKDKYADIATERSAVAHNFMNACRLIAIHRNGRLNVFTFARGNEIFTIETMGLLSDIPDEWRRQAGLDQ